jgi:Spy/CpxP family protein refolding chaperone
MVMKSMMLVLLIAVVSLALVTSAGAAAPTGPFEEAGRLVDELAGRLGSIGADLVQQIQQGRGGMGMPGRMMGDPAERPLITIMLHHRTELGLTPEQVTRLEAIRGEFAREAIRRGADIRIAELDLGTLLEQDPVDLAKAEAKTREVAQLRVDLRIARLRAVEQGMAVLTAEQRTRLQSMLSGGMHHGMPGAPGMPAPRRSADTGIRL